MNGTYHRWITRYLEPKTDILWFASQFSILRLILCDCPDKPIFRIFSDDTSFYLNNIFFTMKKEATKIAFWFKENSISRNITAKRFF